MKKIILAAVVLVVIFGGYITYRNNTEIIESIEKTENSYYKKLRANCENKEDKECCLDSLESMKLIGAEEKITEECPEGTKINGLLCISSYQWCEEQKDSNLENLEEINNLDSPDTIERICTSEAKGCPDGTFVGRTGPNCEFAKCPGKSLKPDFVPTEFNQIQLPDNIISEKDCVSVGGEVWNTLGETSYEGELIGKIEGMKCPCACLVKAQENKKNED